MLLAPFKISIQKILDVGLEVFIIRLTFTTRMKQFYIYAHVVLCDPHVALVNIQYRLPAREHGPKRAGRLCQELLMLWAVKRFGEAAASLAQPKARAAACDVGPHEIFQLCIYAIYAIDLSIYLSIGLIYLSIYIE